MRKRKAPFVLVSVLLLCLCTAAVFGSRTSIKDAASLAEDQGPKMDLQQRPPVEVSELVAVSEPYVNAGAPRMPTPGIMPTAIQQKQTQTIYKPKKNVGEEVTSGAFFNESK